MESLLLFLRRHGGCLISVSRRRLYAVMELGLSVPLVVLTALEQRTELEAIFDSAGCSDCSEMTAVK